MASILQRDAETGASPFCFKSSFELWSLMQELNAPLQALFEQAVSEKCGQHFPLLWRCYMSYEMHRGRPDAARRILLRAVHTCPGAKALWIDGLHFLAEQVVTVFLVIMRMTCKSINSVTK